MSNTLTHIDNKPSLRASHCEDEGRRNLKQSHPLVPALRFREFSGEWNKRKLKSFENKERKVLKAGPFGSAIKKEDYVPQGYKVYGQEQVIKGDPYYGSYFVDEKKFNQLKSCNVLPGDLLISLVGTFGKVLLIPENAQKGIINPRLLRISISNNEVLSNYLKCFFLTPIAIKALIARSQGGTMGVLNSEIVSSIHVPYPTLPEQQKIASFLSSVDEKIQQLTKKKALLEQYKKGLMQKLFSGQLRFKDEKGKDYPDWEEKRLGEIAIFLKGKGISKIDLVEGGDTPCIRYGELYTKYSETIYEVKSRTNIPLKDLVLSELDDVIIPASGETQIDIATASCVRKEKIALGGDLNVIRSSSDGVFLAYYLNNALKHSIARLSQGSSVMHLYSSQLKTLKLSVPPKVEQQKIATYLSGIDTKIESVNSQITQTQTFKKGLLQQMFV
jgi:type I restriction enzyme S subunit